jgi:putative SOS response-associated peptidase YedK
MCGRVTLTKSGEEVAEAFGLDEAPEIEPRYNIAPSQPVLVVRPEPGPGEAVSASGPPRSAALLRWGLRTLPEDKPLINARAETVRTRGAFKAAFAARRCLVPADGFYEWQGPKGVKFRQAYHLRMRGMALFGLAGIWEPGFADEPGSLAILTTAPNDVLAPIHDRMPVIVRPADYATWLDPATPPPALAGLLGPYASAAMEAVPVGEAVNSARRDDPSCLLPPTAVQGRLI